MGQAGCKTEAACTKGCELYTGKDWDVEVSLGKKGGLNEGKLEQNSVCR